MSALVYEKSIVSAERSVRDQMPNFAVICMMVAFQKAFVHGLAEMWVAIHFKSFMILINKSTNKK